MNLNLNELFFELKDEVYCIIKPDENLPEYKKGSDIDIFCYDSNNIVSKILKFGNKYVNNDLQIHISNLDSQLYVDFFDKISNLIELRFDIYTSMPIYNNVLIKPAFFDVILENRITKKISNKYNIFIPNDIDNYILRYIEYQEWYGQRPDKIKHINFILNSCNESDKYIFLQKLHYFTALPRPQSTYPIKKTSITPIKSALKKIEKLSKNTKSFIKNIL